MSISESPEQTGKALDDVIVASGACRFVTCTGAATPLHPEPLLTVSVYVAAFDTLIDAVVAPFDHR